MAIIRWEPARELHTVQSEINRLWGSFFDTPTHAAVARTARWIPATDLVESDSEYVLRADLPGLSEEDVNIEVADGVLTVSGERKTENEERRQGYHRLERASGSFRRSLRLPEGVDADAITASFDKGVLDVHVPKPAARQPHKVAITVGDGRPAIEA
ncbi:MAG TPA: Hsp20/alpha crystallin family protein [Solirubrobacteraceae bacterium]|jgi:HSP20 family protein|nr:Hsp20/alpha crystallin family protein [Solirubrobacteraceae bacterium]